MSVEKNVSYQANNTYSTLNTLSDNTKNVWIVFHGLGYLSRYFIRYFKNLDPQENYIIAPQAPSKYYQDSSFKHIGACWLTRENTTSEIENVLTYIQSVWEKEIPSQNNYRIFILGYSQGVSIATRWIKTYQVSCDQLILHSGGIPTELKASDFDFFQDHTQVLYLYGNQDPYITEAKKTEAKIRGNTLFKNLQVKVFSGKHEVYSPIFPILAQ